MRYIFWLLTLLLTAVFIIFTVANREPVVIDLWPFEIEQALPFSLVVLASLLFGFLVGTFLMWLRFGAARARARQAEQRAAVLERELTNLKRSRAAAPPQGLPGAAGRAAPAALTVEATSDRSPRPPAASGSG